MTPDEDGRWRDGITSAVAALQAGERHSIEDREAIRREIRESETRILRAIGEVDEDCKDFRREVKETWGARDERSRGVTVAWIGGAFLLLAAILNTIATLLT